MTFTQLEYITALDNYRHFVKAAAHCFVTQPTLSMQIQKMEDELGVKIFDRTKQPVLPTEQGVEIIQYARKILSERDLLLEHVDSKKGLVHGELKVGIIPTVAPYLLPFCLPVFTNKYPMVKLVVNELTTENIITKLREGKIDAGILVTPLHEIGIQENILFYEELVAYTSRRNELFKKRYLLPGDIDPNKLLLLEEGHCFRAQTIHLCSLRRISREGSLLEYEAGSLETLRRMVDRNDGITILPELATLELSRKQQQQVRYFRDPVPVREVSLVTHRHFVKKKLIEFFRQVVLSSIPEKVKKNRKSNIIPI